METFLNTIDNLTEFQAVMYLLLPMLVIIIIACFASTVKWFKDLFKEEEDVKPDETYASVRYKQTEELHEQDDEQQTPFVGIDLASGKDYTTKSTFKDGKLVDLRIIDDPTLITDDTIIHMN